MHDMRTNMHDAYMSMYGMEFAYERHINDWFTQCTNALISVHISQTAADHR